MNKRAVIGYLAIYASGASERKLGKKTEGVIWAKAKISFLHKKGSKLDPNNYRMLAVSGTLYRLYANILRELVTKWCVENR
jgi:hypothetical protein